MGWRIIHVTQIDQMSLQMDNLRIKKQDTDVRIPLRDIYALVIEDLACKITSRLMIELSKNNVLVILCNQKYLPECMIQPISGHSTHHKQMMRQLSWSEQHKGVLWQGIIKQKIKNQSIIMKRMMVEHHRIIKMNELVGEVVEQDAHNHEGQAARVYFNSFFENDYKRGDDTLVENGALNYGYTILHSAIARTIVAKGLISGLGIHHKGERNTHNLASDFIEPFRPLVDLFVLKNSPGDFLTRDYRVDLINLLHARVEIDQKMQTIIRAIEIMIDSVIEYFDTGDISIIKLPQLNKVKYHES